MRRKTKKAFNAIFMMVFTSFNIFLFLFATRVTPWDIDYFIADTKEKTAALATFVSEKRTAIGAGKPETSNEKVANAQAISATADGAETPDSAQAEADTKNENGETILKSDTLNVVYYSQTDARWKDEIYGVDNTIGEYGCGPTALAMVLSSLTDTPTTPLDAAKWSFDNGHFSIDNGSYHSIIPKGAEKHGLNCVSLKSPTKDKIIDELNKGHMIVVLMSKGTFTTEGHFIILRDMSDDSEVLIADPKSLENSQIPWDLDIILNEAKYSASYGGPFWSISKP